MFWSQTIILGVVFTIGQANGQAGVLTRIFGGSSALIENYPYQASLRVLDTHYCGGSIISERHILTAAHCINKYTTPPFSYVRVVTGTSYRDRPGTAHRISSVHVHPGWRPVELESYPNDLAVITLKDKITFDKYQRKIDLPSHRFEDGHPVNLTGWGLTRQSPQTRHRQLQLLETTLVSREKCQKRISPSGLIKIYDTQVCAFRSHGRGPCSGDSGGPLAANGELVGVVSWVAGEYCAVGIPEVYTSVYEYKDFVNGILGDFEGA